MLNQLGHIVNSVGLLITNVASRNKEMRTEILRSISSTCPTLISIPIPEDINEVVVGLPLATCAAVADNSPTHSDNKVASMSEMSEPLQLLESIEVKNTLAKLAAVVSKNSGGRFDTGDLNKEWASLLSNATKLVH